MSKSLGMLLAVLLVAAMSAPAMGATISVGGKYVGEVVYDDGQVYSKNPYAFDEEDELREDKYVGVDLLRMSTLYLDLDFAEGETMSAHIPLRLYKAIELEVDQNPDDNYLFVYKGTPLTLSFTDATEGDYAFASFGDPLGLVATIGDGDRATLKVAGQPFGVNFTGYAISMEDEDGPGNPRYAFGRATYGLPGGYTIGAVVAASADDNPSTDPADAEVPARLNVEGDITGPLQISEGATFTAAFAFEVEKDDMDDPWGDRANAFELNVAGVALGNLTLSGNVRAVDSAFDAIAEDADDSDIDNFKGVRQIQGEAVTNVNIAGQAVKLTLGDDYRVAYDGTANDDSYNKASASAEFSPVAPVKVTVGGFYQAYLTDAGAVADDYRKNVYGEVEYKPVETITVTGGAEWMGANLGDAVGSGFKLDGSIEAKPVAGVLVEGGATYESGEYDFIDDDTVDDSHTRLDGEIYAEAKQSLVAAGVKQVDATVAGLARGVWLNSPDSATTYIGYADANIVLNDVLSDKIAVLVGKSTEDENDISHCDYATTIYNKLTYAVSANSKFEVGYTYKYDADDGEYKGALDAAYTVTLGESTIKLSFGEDGLGDECDDDIDDGRPWEWVVTADPVADHDLYKLTITIPF